MLLSEYCDPLTSLAHCYTIRSRSASNFHDAFAVSNWCLQFKKVDAFQEQPSTDERAIQQSVVEARDTERTAGIPTLSPEKAHVRTQVALAFVKERDVRESTNKPTTSVVGSGQRVVRLDTTRCALFSLRELGNAVECGTDIEWSEI